MELHLFVLRERKNIFLARHFSARHGHGFHTLPYKIDSERTLALKSGRYDRFLFYVIIYMYITVCLVSTVLSTM